MEPPEGNSKSIRLNSRRAGLITTLVLVGLITPLLFLSPWILSGALILGCGVYVAFEFALVKVSLRELERDADRGVRGAAILLGMKRDMNAMLAACQFGITLTSLGLTLALEPAIHEALVDYERLAEMSEALAMGLGAFVHVTFGELIPKGLALVVPRSVLHVTAPFMRLFRVLAVPFIKTCNAIANAVVKTITGKNPDVDGHQEESAEIGEALLYAHAQGRIAPTQLKLMRNVLTFADRTAREVMTPARLVVCLDLKTPWAENFRIADEHGFSRFPVTNGNQHDVVGYVRRADLLRAELHGKRQLGPLMRPIERLPETARLALLNLFKGTPMIALYDEHDSFAGMLTAEDVIEQIVGEIYDDTDEEVETPTLERQPDGSMRIDGSVLLEDASDALGAAIIDEDGDVDTIGGLVLKKLGRQPRRGDQVEVGPYLAMVEATQGFRIPALILRPLPVTDPEE